jgi:hypothetical protein
MISAHIKKLTFIDGTWVIELKNSQIIKGTGNLAESFNIVGKYVQPMPELSVTKKLSDLGFDAPIEKCYS